MLKAALAFASTFFALIVCEPDLREAHGHVLNIYKNSYYRCLASPNSITNYELKITNFGILIVNS